MKLHLISLTVLAVFGGSLGAAPEPKGLGDPGKLQSIRIETGRTADGQVLLTGPDASQQILVTGAFSSGQSRDLTRQARYSSAPIGVVAVDPAGVVTPLKDGKAEITAEVTGAAPVRIGVTVMHFADDPRVSFANEVAPVFTRLGCNTGSCHGKASGQNGFKLSLFGFEPGEDYEFIVREGRGRRIAASAPDGSLLLLKATAQMPHGGGKRLEKGSPFHELLRRWIRQGAPSDASDAPTVRRIVVLPRERLLDRNASQQMIVTAQLSDGSTIDVTRLAQFESNQPEMAAVSPTGIVTPTGAPGSVAIMARFQSHVDALRVLVPLGAPVVDLPPSRNFIDELVFKQLKELGLPPSALCDDSAFLRRVTIDVAGRLPTKEEIQQYLADALPEKRGKLIDRLLASGDHADYFANKWSAVLRNRRPSDKDDPKATFAFHAWIRDSLDKNKPYDQFVREILTAEGELSASPTLVWYREVKEPTAQLEDVAQLFLGQRIQCARCHHHPLEKWSQQDYYGLAAFFSRLEVKEAVPPKKVKKGEPEKPGEPFRVSFKPGKAEALHLRTNRPVRPAGLGGQVLDIPPDADPRHQLVDWLTAKENPYFARALVNRYWKHFLGRGLVDPEDDMRVTNPPSNPELLDALARHFIAHDYDLKDLVRTICTSQVYRLGAEPNAYNARDKQNFSRFLPRRLQAEVLLDAIDTVTGSKTSFKGAAATTRAVQLPDNQFESYFLSAFGRPDSASACECERNSDASLAQALHLLNSEELLEKISGRKIISGTPDPKGKKGQPQQSSGTNGGRIRELLADKRPDLDKLRDLYLIALSREPSKAEADAMLAHIQKKGDAQAAYEDILWALINTKEFLFNH
jgi:Protein of unknown function (DUF1553)/Protein of unknown function (DUF1549)